MSETAAKEFIPSMGQVRLADVAALRKRREALDTEIVQTKAQFEAEVAASRRGTQTNYPDTHDDLFLLTIKRWVVNLRLRRAQKSLLSLRRGR